MAVEILFIAFVMSQANVLMSLCVDDCAFHYSNHADLQEETYYRTQGFRLKVEPFKGALYGLFSWTIYIFTQKCSF